MKKLLVVVVIFLFSGIAIFAQWECRSKMGASLKPVGESNLMWAGETVGSVGYLSNKYIASGMGFLGVDYSSGKSTLYFEGGIKYWNQKGIDEDISFDNYRWGLREVFYSYRGVKGKLTAGLHSSKLGDQYLLNERILGLSYHYSSNKWNLNFTSGSVSKDIARNGTFCTTCYLYDIVPIGQNDIGNAFGKTNMAGLTIGFLSGKKVEKESSSDSGDEFDEFSAMDEFSSPSLFQVDELGLALYSEFGSEVKTSFFTAGLYSSIKLPGEISFKPEVLFQAANNHNGVVAVLSLDKNFLWGNGHKTTLEASYYGFYKIDDDAVIQNRFSNSFIGEVLRLEAKESPLYSISAKHIIPQIKAHIKSQYVFSDYESSLQEFDVQIGKTFMKQLQINAILGYIKSDLILNEDTAKLARLELRVNF